MSYEVIVRSLEAASHHTVQVQLATGQVASFDRVRFYHGATPLMHWKETADALGATYWVRLPSMSAGITRILVMETETDYAPASFAPQLLASVGTKLWLETQTKGVGSVDLPTVHPKCLVAQGWMKKETAAGGDIYTRVLVDTPWPSDEINPVGTQPSDHENPSLWVSQDDGETWAWPPLAGFPGAGNILVEKPSGGFNSDPTMLFVVAGSLPGGGPAADTLYIWNHRRDGTGKDYLVCTRLTSTDGSWTGMQSTGPISTNLSDVVNVNYYAHQVPAVVQLDDGSFRMWERQYYGAAGNYQTVIRMYESDDGLTWEFMDVCNMPLPKGLAAPWHYDVIFAGGHYWLAGSFPTQRVALESQGVGRMSVFLMRSTDGVDWELILPCGLRPGFDACINDSDVVVPASWNRAGAYRPSMLWLGEGQGMEWYIGVNDRFESGTDGGTGRWVDATWSPTVPRLITEPITAVFHGAARDFGSGQREYFAFPLCRGSAAGWDGTATIVSEALHLATDKVETRAFTNGRWMRPRDYEFRCRAKRNLNNIAALSGVSTHGWYLAGPGEQSWMMAVRHNSTAALLRTAIPGGVDPTAYQVYRLKRIADKITAQVANVNMTVVGDGTGATEATTAGFEELSELAGFRCSRWSGALPATLDVDWFFYRDVLASDPVVNVQPRSQWASDGVVGKFGIHGRN